MARLSKRESSNRIRILIRWLRKVTKKKGNGFSIYDWGYEVPCGIVACAGGFATLCPALRKKGLQSIVRNGAPTFIPKYRDREAISALTTFFGLDERDGGIFSPSGYSVGNPRPRHVIARLNKVLQERGAKTA